MKFIVTRMQRISKDQCPHQNKKILDKLNFIFLFKIEPLKSSGYKEVQVNQIPETDKFFKGNQRDFFLVWVYMDRKVGLP